MGIDLASARQEYAENGVVYLPSILDKRALADAQAAYDWSLEHPGPLASRVPQASDATFYQDLYNPGCMDAYRCMLQASPVPALVASLWGSPDVWFMYEQVFLKEGGESRRTPWHQDSSYLTVAGRDLAVAWISFDKVTTEDGLEFVRGSHRGPLYNGSRFELGDDTAPLHSDAQVPRLPDIEADRARYDIVSFAVTPGDLVVFHPGTLHGGAATHKGNRRRTLTLRFFGRDAVYDVRPGPAGPRIEGFHQRMTQGAPFRDPTFLKLVPPQGGPLR